MDSLLPIHPTWIQAVALTLAVAFTMTSGLLHTAGWSRASNVCLVVAAAMIGLALAALGVPPPSTWWHHG